MTVRVPQISLQADFAHRLQLARAAFMQPALLAVVRQLDIAELDSQVRQLVPGPDLAMLASRGLRGELVFATPLLLRANARLLTYYRLLLGFSQKEFYTSTTGLSQFKSMEESGRLGDRAARVLEELCRELSRAACELCREIGYDRITMELLDQLTLLTLGPQFRGGANVRRGISAIGQVFQVIQAIVSPYLLDASETRLRLKNAAGREVIIRFASDPDIVISELRSDGKEQLIVAIEVKGGTDFSNIHNRIGEAEKSHQKARRRGFTECWTVVNVSSFDLKLGKSESPSTDQFFILKELLDPTNASHAEFRTRLIHLTSIPDLPREQARRGRAKKHPRT